MMRMATSAPSPGAEPAGSAAVSGERATSAGPLDAPLKLVIWDLDETLWSGTLSEGEVSLDPERAEIVRELNRRGIMSSICSKNDFAAARERLTQEGIWEQFVFPSISWSPKGAQIKQIVEDMQLRPPNVLFIDDNVGNLEEALYYLPGIQTAYPDVLERLLSLPQAAGKDDSALTRLAQYRVLERKVADRAVVSGSNEEFLRSCDIRVELAQARAEDTVRLLELINRTNQLNFTKSRIGEEELRAMLAQPGRDTGYVHVYDRYGDYGVCGVYSVLDGRLSDFVFSCRILHMGVEQWLYAHLGEPQLTISGDVASSLDAYGEVDWITLVETRAESPSTASTASEPAVASSSRVLLKGGCDLALLHGFLGGSIRTEFTYPSATGAEVHGDHTEVLRRSSKALVAEYGAIIDRLPFLDRAAYASRIVRAPKSLGTVIFSVLMDYTQGLYRLRGSDFVAPYGQHDLDATDPANWAAIEQRWGSVGIDRPFLEWFAESFEFEGALSPHAFQENIRWLAGLLPAGSTLVLINGAEVALENENEPSRHLHHQRMNRALEEVVEELPNATILDVREIVTSPQDVTDNIRHYTRQIYLRMAERLADTLAADIAVEQRPFVMRLNRARRRLVRNLDRAAGRFQLRS
jgi:FkbH-like protein